MDGDGGIAADGGARKTVLDLAAQLLERLRDGGLRELEVRHGGVRVKVLAEPGGSAGPVETERPAGPVVGQTAPTPERVSAPAAAVVRSVNAPLTGIFYRSPSPQAPPFVVTGGVVNVGDVVGLIEAMKLFNEVRSTVAGRVMRIVAESGQLVRAHQPIVELE